MEQGVRVPVELGYANKTRTLFCYSSSWLMVVVALPKPHIDTYIAINQRYHDDHHTLSDCLIDYGRYRIGVCGTIVDYDGHCNNHNNNRVGQREGTVFRRGAIPG